MSEQFRRDREPADGHWAYDRFKAVLIAAFDPERFQRGIVSFEQLPTGVDIGKFGDKARECVMATSQDGKERGFGIEFVPADKKLVIDKQIMTGGEHEVLIGNPAAMLSLHREQVARLSGGKRLLFEQMNARLEASGVSNDLNRVLEILQSDTMDGKIMRETLPIRVGNIHSHPRPTPISSYDLVTLLKTPELRFMVLGKAGGGFELVMKSHETVVLDEQTASEKSRAWKDLLDARVTQGVQRDGLGLMEANIRAQTALARTIARKYKLGYYTGDATGLLGRITE